jgi:hypothetical protein
MPPQQPDRLLDRIDIVLGIWAHGAAPQQDLAMHVRPRKLRDETAASHRLIARAA